MKEEIVICTAQPIDEYFVWQNHLYIESCIDQGFKAGQIHILLFKPYGREMNNNWYKLQEFYPGLQIFVYEDKNIESFFSTYIPVLRPNILAQHFSKYKELESKTILYTDSDILYTSQFSIDLLLNNNTSYVSDAASYLNYDYFTYKSKESSTLKIDVLDEICKYVGISKQVVIDNNKNTGGVQYLLKNVSSEFWKKVEKDVKFIRQFLLTINKEHFKSENDGFQSWCADLWAVQFNLWYFNKNTMVTKALDFCWATDSIDRIIQVPIYHNAGATGDFMNDTPIFYKGKYHRGSNPFIDPHLDLVINNPDSKRLATSYYANKLKQLKIKYYE